jgi:BirA family biotin operon repressor/biotin-[acetyl-CoA-carboxylase] ligase
MNNEILIVKKILSQLKTKWLGKSLFFYKNVTSTNDLALQWINQKVVKTGSIIIANTQTAGRGRFKRKWFSSNKGLWFSIILNISNYNNKIPDFFTIATSVGIVQAFETFKLKATIKWPNDVFLNNKKICGILTEVGYSPQNEKFLIIGIGVNVNQSRKDFPIEIQRYATSIFLEKKIRISKFKLLQIILSKLEGIFLKIQKGEHEYILTAWKHHTKIMGRQVEVFNNNKSFFGEVQKIDLNGNLYIRTDQGVVKKINAGEIRILSV